MMSEPAHRTGNRGGQIVKHCSRIVANPAGADVGHVRGPLLAVRDGRKMLCHRTCGIALQPPVRCDGDVEHLEPARAGTLCRLPRVVQCGDAAAEDHLVDGVDVGDPQAVAGGSGTDDIARRAQPQPGQCGHPPLTWRARLGHGITAQSHRRMLRLAGNRYVSVCMRVSSLPHA
jgi:hypothetical protein